MAQSVYSLSFTAASSQDVNIGAGAPSVGVGSAFTISAWVKQTSTSSGYRSVYVGNANNGLWVNAGKLDYYDNADNTGSATLSADTWYHVGVTYDGTTLKLWLNGTQDFSAAASHSLAAGGDTGIGGHGAEYFDGKIDDVGVWKSCLTPTQIANLAAGTLDPSTISPDGLWRFEDGSGTTATDTGSGGHNGTLRNGPSWSTDVPSQLAGAAAAPVGRIFQLNQSVQSSLY